VHSNPAHSTTKSDYQEEDPDYLADGDKNDYDDEYSDEGDQSRSSLPVAGSTTEKPFETTSSEVKGEAGKSVTLKCNGEGFDSNPVVMWYNGSRLLFQGTSKNTNDKRIEFSKLTDTMVISDVNSYDDGAYRCRIYGKKNYETFIDLQVNGPPRGISIHEHSQKTIDIAGTTFKYHAGQKNLVFTCNVAKSRPAAKIDWIHNGNTILESQIKDHDLKIEENQLTIKNVHARHAGEYQCEASNELGNEKATFNVDVECEYLERISVVFLSGLASLKQMAGEVSNQMTRSFMRK
jgi:uncharacterized protein YodC (DUF2158 family)